VETRSWVTLPNSRRVGWRHLFSTFMSGCKSSINCRRAPFQFLTFSVEISLLSKGNLYDALIDLSRNNRRLDNKLNIFEGISRNWFFIGINIITILGQVLIVFLGSSALSTVRLDSTQWAISLFLGALSLPIAVLIRLIPDDFIRKLLPTRLLKRPTTYDTIPSDDRFEWNPALQDVRDQLFFFKTIRGGFHAFPASKKQPPQTAHTSDYRESRHAAPDNHVNGNGTASPRHRLERSRSRSSTALGPATVMAGIIAGSIAGWSPTPRSTENANGHDSPNERTRLLG
jgi:Ca2+-transporting ATPase